jgi:hypothetical protein
MALARSKDMCFFSFSVYRFKYLYHINLGYTILQYIDNQFFISKKHSTLIT